MTAVQPPPCLRILLVDNNADERAKVRRLLIQGNDRPYAFVEASSAAEALQAVRDRPTSPLDCMILHYFLPDASGEEALAALMDEEGGLRLPVVVVAAGNARALGPRVLRAGAQDFVDVSRMPADILVRIVDNAVER